MYFYGHAPNWSIVVSRKAGWSDTLSYQALGAIIWYFRNLKDYMSIFNDAADLMIQKLSERADGKSNVRLLDFTEKVTLDVVCKVQPINNNVKVPC